MIDYRSLLYDPLYSGMGVAAALTSAAGDEVSVTILDRTAGVDVGVTGAWRGGFGDRTTIETINPAVLIRAGELADNAIDVADLTDGEITFSGATWRIKSIRPRPSSNGEAAGQYYLFLLQDEG